ncbi:MAG: glycosyl hydrolase 43 family protein [Ruminococcaceae bacterium]|nr:glycosyl hydrolase 43 family protein [Oscillospiraceae bacterium]
MFQYLHCYLPQTWDAQVRAGLINGNAGIRFVEAITCLEHLKFNNLAKPGGDLFNVARELNGPFYIDRLQGGCYIEDYPYDMSIVQAYRDMLGDRFWGFQMHEWMSNHNNDFNKLKMGHCPEWTAKAITDTIFRVFPFRYAFLESMTAEELAAAGCPGSLDDFIKSSEMLFARRQAYTGGMLLPCDSFYLSYPIELKLGAKRLMPEIGSQTPDTRIQVAYARGMAKAYRIPFGTYYEPWGGEPFAACCYQRDGSNEWNLGGPSDFPFHTEGENGGSSRSMQRRLHLYSYMAGASFMSEEWGMCNTFYDWNDFELSPYGIVKRDFIRFTERYPDIGKPIVPIAVVLPKELPAFEMDAFDSDTYLGYPVYGSFAEKLKNVKTAVRKLFCESGPMLGTETRTLLNCTLPDALDMVQEDCVKTDDYQWFIDLTGSDSFAKKAAGKICSVDEAGVLLDEALPCTVRGNGMKQFTKTDDGTVYVLFTNNSGVIRSVADGEVLLKEAAEVLTVMTKNGQSLQMLEGAAASTLMSPESIILRFPQEAGSSAHFADRKTDKSARRSIIMSIEINYNDQTVMQNGFPVIRKMGAVSPCGESSPFEFHGRIYRLELQDSSHGINSNNTVFALIRDRETGEILSRFGRGCYYYSLYQENDTVYVIGTKYTPPHFYSSTLMIFESRDLITWTCRELLGNPGWKFFNTSLTKGPDGYVLCVETEGPPGYDGIPFTAFFAASKDMIHWEWMDYNKAYPKERYIGGPWLRYSRGYYYLTGNAELPCNRFGIYIYRTKDFDTWEIGYYNPIMLPGIEDKKISPYAYDLTKEHLSQIRTGFVSGNLNFDMCDWNKKSLITYNAGNLCGFCYLAEAEYDGSVDDFLDANFH